VDKEYPVRSAFCVVNKVGTFAMTPQPCPTMSALHSSRVILLPRHATQVIDDFVAIHGDKWRTTTADCAEATGLLEPALTKYQVPILVHAEDMHVQW